MKQIPLTQGQFALVDDEDFEELNQFKWYALKTKNTYYACRNFKNIDENKRIMLMHRQILKLKDPKIEADHIDNNGLNNQKINLRECSSAQNKRNTKSHKDSFSKYKGVSWHKKDKRWRVRIIINSKCTHIGNFKDEIEAAKAYDEMARIHHGEFANLNFKD